LRNENEEGGCEAAFFPAGPGLPSEVLALCRQVWYSTGRKIGGIAGSISTMPDLCNMPV
jgi:hypothetical protein